MIPARLRAPLGWGAAFGAATLYVALVDPNSAGHYPLCPTKALTGLDCPACGGLRAIHSLTHGDVLGALDHNLLVTIAAPVAVIVWAVWLWRRWRQVGPPSGAFTPLAARIPTAAWVVPLVVVLVGFTVLRNIGGVPVFAWLGSGVA